MSRRVRTAQGTALRLSLVAFFLLLGAGPVQGQCVAAPANLVSWWDGDAVVGPTASDIQDGNDGTLTNGVAIAAGQVGNAFSFDGIDDYIDVPSNANLRPTVAMTTDAWVRLSVDMTTISPTVCSAVKGIDAEAPADWALCVTGTITGSPGKVRPHVRVPSGWFFFDCGTSLLQNVWYHVAMTYDGANLRCYVNGASDGSLALTGALQTSTGSLRIGAYAPVNGIGSKGYFPGDIDEVEFFDVALSQPDLQAIHDAGAAGKCKLTPTPTPTVTPTPTCTPLIPVGPTPTPAFGAKAGQKCQRAIAKEASKFVKAKTKALQKCKEAVVKDKYAGVCPDEFAADGSAGKKAFEKIGKATSKLSAKIAKKCGGDNKTCGSVGDPDTGEEAPANLGFYTACPNFEGGTCNFAVADCADLAACVECIAGAAVDQAMSLYYGSLIDTDPDLEKALNKCQQTIGKETSKFLLAKEKIVLKCWDKILKGQGPGSGNDKVGSATCPDLGGTPGLAAQKAALKIIKAESKKVTKICKACGGTSKTCDLDVDTSVIVDGGETIQGDAGPADDFSPAAIGFATACPAVTLPVAPGTACDTLDDIDGVADTIDTLRELILCADCVTEFKVDCIDAGARPEYQPYPCECQ